MLNTELILGVVEYLGIQKPYDIRLVSKENADAAGYCEQRYRKGKIIKHVITIFLPTMYDSGFTLESVVLHELIHALQAENQTLVQGNWHGEEFQDTAMDLEEMFGVTDIYSPDTDVD